MLFTIKRRFVMVSDSDHSEVELKSTKAIEALMEALKSLGYTVLVKTFPEDILDVDDNTGETESHRHDRARA